jgi:hypothetical protein
VLSERCECARPKVRDGPLDFPSTGNQRTIAPLPDLLQESAFLPQGQRAVRGLSPVTITGLMPIPCSVAQHSRRSRLTMSCNSMTSRTRGPSATTSGEQPARAMSATRPSTAAGQRISGNPRPKAASAGRTCHPPVPQSSGLLVCHRSVSELRCSIGSASVSR